MSIKEKDDAKDKTKEGQESFDLDGYVIVRLEMFTRRKKAIGRERKSLKTKTEQKGD